ncbi:hypothetical protein EGW08_017335 [Elysia chlorotica]|uniref:Uncharacterized protein n=1 Tax=Elysia chlorotica TaxID=188477 RepID=A0A3S1B4J2_ELYCH|nr:hypothetical protein EGW08_017335 [Elysia chlorotica]
MIDGKRSQGRQIEKMADGMKEWLQISKVTEMMKLTREREIWRDMITNAMRHAFGGSTFLQPKSFLITFDHRGRYNFPLRAVSVLAMGPEYARALVAVKTCPSIFPVCRSRQIVYVLWALREYASRLLVFRLTAHAHRWYLVKGIWAKTRCPPDPLINSLLDNGTQKTLISYGSMNCTKQQIWGLKVSRGQAKGNAILGHRASFCLQHGAPRPRHCCVHSVCIVSRHGSDLRDLGAGCSDTIDTSAAKGSIFFVEC